jgi:hypothetical protein
MGCSGGVVYIVVSSQTAIKEIGATGRKIESREGIGKVVAFFKKDKKSEEPPSATEEFGAMGREIESHQGIEW